MKGEDWRENQFALLAEKEHRVNLRLINCSVEARFVVEASKVSTTEANLPNHLTL